jgi:hypothetical protein
VIDTLNICLLHRALRIHGQPGKRLDILLQIGQRMPPMPIPHAELAVQPITLARLLQAQKAHLLLVVLRVLAEIVGIVTHFRL